MTVLFVIGSLFAARAGGAVLVGGSQRHPGGGCPPEPGRADDARRLDGKNRRHAREDLHHAAAEHALANDLGRLAEALEGRMVIAQAQGLLMGRHAIDAHAAFQRLVDQSQKRDLRLSEVASELLRDAQRPIVVPQQAVAVPQQPDQAVR